MEPVEFVLLHDPQKSGDFYQAVIAVDVTPNRTKLPPSFRWGVWKRYNLKHRVYKFALLIRSVVHASTDRVKRELVRKKKKKENEDKLKAARRFKYLHDNCYGTPRTLEPFKGLPQWVKTHLRRRLDRCRSADVRVTKKKGFLLGKKKLLLHENWIYLLFYRQATALVVKSHVSRH